MTDVPSQQAAASPEPLRLVFQGSFPIEEIEHGISWYNMLKEMVKSQSPAATLNGQILKMLEPCCNKKPKSDLSAGVV
jgi:hypothetical protein